VNKQTLNMHRKIEHIIADHVRKETELHKDIAKLFVHTSAPRYLFEERWGQNGSSYSK